MPIITETVDEFMRRNGWDGTNAVIAHDRPNEQLLPSGAVIRTWGGGARVGSSQEFLEAPPDDRPLDVLKARIRYQRSLLARESARFNQLRASLRQQAQFHKVAPMNCPPVNRAAVEALRTMRGKVGELRAALDALTSQVPHLPEIAGRAAVRAHQAQQEAILGAEAERAASEIDSITL